MKRTRISYRAMSDADRIYQDGWSKGVNNAPMTDNPHRNPSGTGSLWLNGWYDGQCALAKSKGLPYPESPFKGRVEINGVLYETRT